MHELFACYTSCMSAQPTLPSRLCAAALLTWAMSLPAQAHEMNGIDHVHLSDGVVHIVEPIPGVPSASPNYPAETKTGPTQKSTQPRGLASFLIQIVLIGSVLLLVVVVLKAGMKRNRQREAPPEETGDEKSDDSSNPTPPILPG